MLPPAGDSERDPRADTQPTCADPGAVILAFRRRSKRAAARDERLSFFAGYGRYWDEHLARHHGDWKSAIGEIIYALDRRGALSHGKSSS